MSLEIEELEKHVEEEDAQVEVQVQVGLEGEN